MPEKKERYFLRDGWREVTKEEYVAAERRAGYRNTIGQPNEPATSAFGVGDGVQGRQGFLHDFEKDR